MEKKVEVDQIEVTKIGLVQVRNRVSIFENGSLISASIHRHVIAPGDDYSGEDARVQAICKATHTTDVIAAYKAAMAAEGV